MRETLRVGYALQTREEFNDLPVGTIVRETDTPSTTFTKTATGWETGNGVPMDVTGFELDGFNTIHFLPGRPGETLAQFKWRFRDQTLWATRAHSAAGGVNATLKVLKVLGCMDLTPGPGVALRNEYDLASLPEATVLTRGEVHDPDRYEVWLQRAGVRRIVLGNNHARSGLAYMIAEMPGVDRPGWLDEPAHDDEEEQVVRFKKQAWDRGYEAKVEHGWCPTFEDVMRGLGVIP